MRLKIVNKGFNYSQDGPGNRLVFHLQGCNMRCMWCANPESMDSAGYFMIDKEKLLESVCPYGAISHHHLNREKCRNCETYSCIKENKNEGIRLSYFEMNIEEIMKEVKECRFLFFDHGGVTFSGGEPTLQFDVLKDLLQELKKEGIHTLIETNATHARLEELFPYIDMLVMDFKHINSALHKKFTGTLNEQIKINIGKAMNNHPRVLIRTPLINGVNADEKWIEEFISFYKQFNSENTQFEFLKFHEYGKEKWKQCGLEYQMKDGYITDGIREIFEKEYRANGLKIVRT